MGQVRQALIFGTNMALIRAADEMPNCDVSEIFLSFLLLGRVQWRRGLSPAWEPVHVMPSMGLPDFTGGLEERPS